MRHLSIESEGYEIDLNLRSQITIICGDAEAGSSFYELMSREATREDILCINYSLVRSKANYNMVLKTIESSKQKIIIINQADSIQKLNNAIVHAINADIGINTYIVIGKAPNLDYKSSDLATINIHDNKITLDYLFSDT